MRSKSKTDAIWQRDEIQSPCVNICVIHPQTRLCTGCLRSIDEIRDWSSMSPDTRHQIMLDLPTRESQHKKRRGGRAARLNR